MLKKVLLVIASLFLIFVLFITGFVLRERFYMAKFRETKLALSVAEVIDKWGKPDDDLIKPHYASARSLFYRTGFSEFVFSFNEKGVLIKKYAGD